MSKQEFLARLGEALRGLPQDDIAERLAFYNEMIDDRLEDGLSEETAVAELGPVENIVSQIVAETPFPVLVRERVRPKRSLRAWEIVLLALGFPIWLPLLISAAAVLLSVYVVIWAVVLSLWAVAAAFVAGAFGGGAMGLLQICQGSGQQGLIMLSAGIMLAGLSIFLFFGCKALSAGGMILTEKTALGVKSMFLRKESAG